jgi:hypothetical protein
LQGPREKLKGNGKVKIKRKIRDRVLVTRTQPWWGDRDYSPDLG